MEGGKMGRNGEEEEIGGRVGEKGRWKVEEKGGKAKGKRPG
jgi:hypothetical protein